MPPKKSSDKAEQEEAFAGQRLEEAEATQQTDVSGGHPGKCPMCGRDKVNS